MSWQILLAISIILLSFNGLFHKSLLRDDKSDPRGQIIVFLGVGGILSIAIAILRGKLQFEFPPSLILYFIIFAALGTAAYLFKYRSFQLINASEVVIFATTAKLWNVVGAAIFLHEDITLRKIVGTIIILMGIAITMYVGKKFKVNKGVIFALLAALFMGSADISGYFILRTMDASIYQIYFYLIPVLTILLIQPASVKKIGYYVRPDRALKVITLALFDTLGILALFLAYQAGGNVSVIGPLSATKVIVTVVFAIIFLKERTNIIQTLIGSAVTVVGVILLL